MPTRNVNLTAELDRFVLEKVMRAATVRLTPFPAIV